MNRRGKRLTIGVMALGLAVVLVFVVLNWGTVRAHVEAWHFQLTRETETITPERGWSLESPNLPNEPLIRLLANCSGRSVVVARATDPALGLWFIISTEGVLQSLREEGFRVLEQRFPRRAYVVIRDDAAAPAEDSPTTEFFLLPFGDPNR